MLCSQHESVCSVEDHKPVDPGDCTPAGMRGMDGDVWRKSVELEIKMTDATVLICILILSGIVQERCRHSSAGDECSEGQLGQAHAAQTTGFSDPVPVRDLLCVISGAVCVYTQFISLYESQTLRHTSLRAYCRPSKTSHVCLVIIPNYTLIIRLKSLLHVSICA